MDFDGSKHHDHLCLKHVGYCHGHHAQAALPRGAEFRPRAGNSIPSNMFLMRQSGITEGTIADTFELHI
jgi:hypothetical protein